MLESLCGCDGGHTDHARRERRSEFHQSGHGTKACARSKEKNAGVSIKIGGVKDSIADENVLQPLLVSTSAIELAAETVKMLLRIDDLVLSR